MIEELSSITFVADATVWVFSGPGLETVMVIPTVAVLGCAEEILFAAGGTAAGAEGTAAGAEGTLLGGPPLADVCIPPAGDVVCMALDNGPELVEVT